MKLNDHIRVFHCSIAKVLKSMEGMALENVWEP